MTTTFRSLTRAVLFTAGVATLLAPTAWAQSNQASSTASSSSSSDNTRPATTTFYGDTGLWFVPTAEVLPDGHYSVSGYRRGTNYIQGYTNVGDFAGTFGYGIKGRAEIFGSIIFDTRIDRDVRPLFFPDPTYGGFVDRYPKVHTAWTGNNFGDIYLGAKINFLSEKDQKPAAVAARFMVKLPTASADNGIGTGKADFLADFIVSKEMPQTIEVSGYAGFEARGSTDNFTLPGGAFRYGVGAGFPSRAPLRITAELNGIANSSSTATYTPGSFPAAPDLSLPPITVNVNNVQRATFAATYQAPKGFFLGVGVSWNVPTQERVAATSEGNEQPGGDYWDWQVRIGYHPGVRKYVAPPPPPPPPPAPPPPAPPTHNLSVRATAEPTSVEVGRTSTVTATVTDSINCAVTYRWSAPSGNFANPTARQTVWTAPNQDGGVPITVTVTCPTDNKTASDTVTVQVTRPAPVVQLTFDDVYFDFDRSTLRPEALRILDDAVTKLQANPGRNVVIEGHTCSIGTAEYNLALGERRAASVRDYLISRGVPAARLQTRSYGEENPKYDNSREETRRLNRRAALTVSVQ
jgi:outer membrane protein OmpA-like peptidoglycan-associated protein